MAARNRETVLLMVLSALYAALAECLHSQGITGRWLRRKGVARKGINS